jgi:hypothetical protein
VVQIGHQDEVLAAGQQVVDGRELAGDPDRGADAVGAVLGVVAGDADVPAVAARRGRRTPCACP